jgi:hypothetical protein
MRPQPRYHLRSRPLEPLAQHRGVHRSKPPDHDRDQGTLHPELDVDVEHSMGPFHDLDHATDTNHNRARVTDPRVLTSDRSSPLRNTAAFIVAPSRAASSAARR